MSSRKVLLGLLAGIAAGATLGVLFAPAKGSSTRRKISKKRDDYTYEAGERFNELIDGVTNKFEVMRDEATRMAKKWKAQGEKVEKAVETGTKVAAN